MDVKYDARAEGGGSKEPTFDDWLVSYPKLGEALQTCSLRFVINLPEATLRTAPRLCFELQEAFWFYLDYLYEGAKKDLPKLNQMNFIRLMLEACDVLKSIYAGNLERQKLMQDWREYCRKVPLRGAVLLNQSLDKCLMVQPWKGEKLTFPRGKINEGETETECAVREVWEETGIDITGRVNEAAFVQADVSNSGCPVKLFMIPGIQEEAELQPKTRKEISKIGWIQLQRLPGWGPKDDPSPLRFLSVEEFVPGIFGWVEKRRAEMGLSTLSSGHPRFCSASPTRQMLTNRLSSVTAALPPPRQKLRSRSPSLPLPPGKGARGNIPNTSPPDKVIAPRYLNSSTSCEKSVSGKEQSSIFPLNLAKVMREFDRGWDSAART